MTMPNTVVDPLTGEEMNQDDYEYILSLRNAIVNHEIEAAPSADGSWSFGYAENPNASDPAMEYALKSSSAEISHEIDKRVGPNLPDTGNDPWSYAGSNAGRMEQQKKRDKAAQDIARESTGDRIEELRQQYRMEQESTLKPPTPVDEIPQMPTLEEIPSLSGAEILQRARYSETGEFDPRIQQQIYENLSGVSGQARKDILVMLREGREMGMTAQESWNRVFKRGGLFEEHVRADTNPAWQQFLDKAAMAILDPVTFAAKKTLGEERYEELPEGVKTAAEWAPILVAPQKGFLRDMTIGGMGLRKGAIAVGGASLTSEFIDDGFLPEVGGSVVAGMADTVFTKRWAGIRSAVKTGVSGIPEIDDDLARELNDEYQAIVDAKPDDMVTVFMAADENTAIDWNSNGVPAGTAAYADMEVANIAAFAASAEPRGVVLGQLQPGASQVTGIHYSNAPDLGALSGDRFGTGIASAEAKRLEGADPRIRNRQNFYIKTTDGSVPGPERGLGNNVYTQTFENILKPGKEMAALADASRNPQGTLDSNLFEVNVIEAGYDGYAIPSMGHMVVFGDQIPVNFRGEKNKLAAEGWKFTGEMEVPENRPKLEPNQMPVLVAVQVPRKSLTVANDSDFVLNGDAAPFVNEASDGYVDNAAATVTNFLRQADEDLPGDVSRLAFGLDPEPDGPYMRTRADYLMSDVLEPPASLKQDVKDQTVGVRIKVGNLEIHRRSSRKWIIVRPDGESIEVATPDAVVQAVSRGGSFYDDVEQQLQMEYDTLAGEPIDYVRNYYKGLLQQSIAYQEAYDTIADRTAKGVVYGYDAEGEARAQLLEVLSKIQRFGEELYIRTDGREGVQPKINRAIDQYRAEREGMVDLTTPTYYSGIPVLPLVNDIVGAAQAVWDYGSDIAEQAKSRPVTQQTLPPTSTSAAWGVKTGGRTYPTLGVGTPTTNAINMRRPAIWTVRLTGVRPINPHRTQGDRVLDVFRAIFQSEKVFGPVSDELGSALVREDRRVEQHLATQTRWRMAHIMYLSNKYFPRDDVGRITNIPGNPTIQDIAADWKAWKPYLDASQNRTIRIMRDAIEPYVRALVEQGVEIRTRKDIRPGGFYLPRGDQLEDGIDYKSWKVEPPRKRGIKTRAERTARYDTMVQGITNPTEPVNYVPFEQAMETFFRDESRRIMDAHWANVLKNSTDLAGVPLHSTPEARLLKQNPLIAKRMDDLRKAVISLEKSLEWMDDDIHAALRTFIHTPAPDLTELRNAVNAMSTAGGKLRHRTKSGGMRGSGLGPANNQDLNWKIIRDIVRKELYNNKGKYKGLTRQEAQRLAFKQAVEPQIKSGRFKGMTFDQGKAHLDLLKRTIKGLEPHWLQAKEAASIAPEGMRTLHPSRFGRLLSNHAFDERLVSVLDRHLHSYEKNPNAVFVVGEAAMNLMRGLRSTLDLSFMGNQGLFGIFKEPGSYAKALGIAINAIGDPYSLGKFLDDFESFASVNGLPNANDWAAAGLHMGGQETEFMIKGARGVPLEKWPGISQSNRAFGYFGDTLRLNWAQTRLMEKMQGNPINIRGSERQAMMEEIAAAVNGLTGWSPGRLAGEFGQFLMFAPRFYLAQFENYARAIAGRRMTRKEARGAILNTLGVGAMITVAANIAAGNEPGNDHFDWWSPTINGRLNRNFMRIRWNKTDISLFGHVDSLIYGLAGAVTGDPAYLARSRANPLVGMLWDIASGEDILGRAVTPGRILRSFLPFTLQDVGNESAMETATGFIGVKGSDMSVGEQRDEYRRATIKSMIADGSIPKEWEQRYKTTPFSELAAVERKFIDNEVAKRNPQKAEEWAEARRQDKNIYQLVNDEADEVDAKYNANFDILFQRLMNGEDPREVWEAYDDERNKRAGAIGQVYESEKNPQAREYRKAVSSLKSNDIRKIEEAWRAIVTKNATGPSTFNWDAIETEQDEFLADLAQRDPEKAKLFAWVLELKDRSSAEENHPMTQLRKDAQVQLDPYYTAKDRGATPQQLRLWLTRNPNADVMKWLTDTTEQPSINSATAAAQALEIIPQRKIHFSGTNQRITADNLPIVQKYDNEITRLLTFPGEATDPRTGRDYSPRTEMRKQDPLYDALYFWLGFSNADDYGTAVVYHIDAVNQYLKQWGPRSDGVKPRQSAR